MPFDNLPPTALVSLLLLFAALVTATIHAASRYSCHCNALVEMFSCGRQVKDSSGQTYMVTQCELGLIMLHCPARDSLRILDIMTPAGTYRVDLLESWHQA